MALNQNQFALTSLKGTKIFGHEDNVMTVEFYNPSAVDGVSPGEFVTLDPSSPAGSIPRVILGTDEASAYFGVVLTNPLVESFVSGDKIEIGLLSSCVLVEASEAINVGEALQYTPSTKKVAPKTASNTVVATALEKASADGDLIKAFIRS